MSTDIENATNMVMKISRAMQPFLQGHGPEIQGAVLADLMTL